MGAQFLYSNDSGIADYLVDTMKPFLLAITGVLLLIVGANAQSGAKPQAPDPIVGNWIWRDAHFVTVNPDGSAVSNKGPRAKWKFLNNKEKERKYQFIWDGGIFIDEITASVDAKTLKAKDQNGVKYVVRRAPDDSDAETKSR